MTKPFDNPGWFAIHNAVFDELMPRLSGAAFRVLCVAIRQTLGWRDPKSEDPKDRKEWDVISYSQFMEKSGIKSSSTIKRAIDELVDLDCLMRRSAGSVPGTGAVLYAYKLNIDYEIVDNLEGDQISPEPKIEADDARFENRSGPTAKIEAVPLRKSKRQNKETNKQRDDDGVIIIMEDLVAFGFNGARKAISQYGAERCREVLEYARRSDELGPGWVMATLKSGELVPDVGSSEAEQGSSLTCPRCSAYPCMCEEFGLVEAEGNGAGGNRV